VTNLSGRGVGLDVVKTAVERIGGHISVFTEKGKGTRFRISLPLTLAVLDGLLVRMGSGLCVLPLQAVLETVAWSSLEAVEIGERALVHYRGRFVPVVWLHEFSTFAGLRVQKPQVGVLVQGDGHELFLPVEEIVGSQQVVVKSLEKNWKRVPGVTGATVLGDGSLALILDASGIERLALGDSARETAEQTSVQVPVA
ncbi:MAG TPA: chemotaxis protein CheA, partial [Bacteroidetes bacterium]|nr:chemotaxis protein CheA [Bacteroidota bacterium]